MPILLESHVHLYPEYDIEDALYFALYNLATIRPDYQYAICLTERESENYFEKLERESFEDLTVKKLDPKTLLVTYKNTEGELLIFKGQQYITSEKLEVLSLFGATKSLSGKTLAETVEQILKDGGLPILPWSFGKWWGRRGKILKAFLTTADTDKIFLGDILLRSTTEKLKFDESSFRVLAGTDPLPLPREEELIGCFATEFEGLIDLNNPSESLKKIIIETKEPKIRGIRDSIYYSAIRLISLKLKKFSKK